MASFNAPRRGALVFSVFSTGYRQVDPGMRKIDMLRNLTRLALNASLLAVLPIVALAQQPPAPAAPPPADPNAAAAAAQQFSINQNVGDWVVRCVLTSVKSPAPCEVLQSTVNKDNQQRISSLSIAYVPSRETYAMQIVVPTGVALAK